jgi:hypothetical protein
MAWADSRVFQEWVKNPLFNGSTGVATSYAGWAGADTFKCALFASGITPDRNAVVGSTGYNTGVWTTGNEKTGSSEWVAGGRALASSPTRTLVASSGTITLDAPDLVGSASITMSSVEGCLIYDDTVIAGNTVADQGMCFLWFGGAQSVTAGTFTVSFNAAGIVTATV